ncbi:hypothetical protein H6G74_24210 [Nostoc spongiaeforme FACHB-130]|uniref:Uncharacterized protein n=1 Tax=Nostoc spongiaeforme FACHB-130 TaxID=1357510 RepID=A0ABR8G2D3_9NOSO|nr:hypothetical protein [Nostoc spongiaeforme]MBD2597401.1 hypothetical protein [Nostoc spongiaeforme FACHB-130]
MYKKTFNLKTWAIRFAWVFVIIGLAFLYLYPVISCRVLHDQTACETEKWQQHNLPNT